MQGIVDKLHRCNPHVFGDAPVTDAASVNELWESVKAAEKARTSVFDGLPPGLPALLLADKVLDRAERAGTPLSVPDSQDLGDRLLALVAEAATAGVDPEHALRDAVRRVARVDRGGPGRRGDPPGLRTPSRAGSPRRGEPGSAPARPLPRRRSRRR